MLSLISDIIITHFLIIGLIGFASSLTMFTLTMAVRARIRKTYPISRRRLFILFLSFLSVVVFSSLTMSSSKNMLLVFLLFFTPFAVYDFNITCGLCNPSRTDRKLAKVMIAFGATILAVIPLGFYLIEETVHEKTIAILNEDFDFYLLAASAARIDTEGKIDNLAQNSNLIAALEAENAQEAYEIIKSESKRLGLDFTLIHSDTLPVIDNTEGVGNTNANINYSHEIGRAYLIQWNGYPFTILSSQTIVDSSGSELSTLFGGTVVTKETPKAFSAKITGDLSLLRTEGVFYHSGNLAVTEHIIAHTPLKILCNNTEQELWIEKVSVYVRVLPMVRDGNLPEDCLEYGASIIISPVIGSTPNTILYTSLIDSTIMIFIFWLFNLFQVKIEGRYLLHPQKEW